MWPFTYDDAAGAANRGAGASVARADANDGDGRAGQADEDIEIGENDAQEAEESRHILRGSLKVSRVSSSAKISCVIR